MGDLQGGFVVALIGLAVISFAFWERRRRSQLAQNGFVVQGRVVRTESMPGARGGYAIHYTFVVDDPSAEKKEYTAKNQARQNFSAGDMVRVRYLRDNPKINVLEDYLDPNGPKYLFWLGGGVLIFAAIIVVGNMR